MPKNMGKFDRVMRIVMAVALAYAALGTSAFGAGILVWLSLMIAAVFALTALAGNCPIYSIIGLKTCRNC